MHATAPWCRPMHQATQCKQKITSHPPTQCAARAQKCCSHECNFLIPTSGTVFDIAKPLDHPRRRFLDQKNRSDPVVCVRAGANPARHSFAISEAPTGLVGRKLLAYEQLSRCALSKGYLLLLHLLVGSTTRYYSGSP